MATPQEELAELNRQIADLKRQLGDTSEFVPLQNIKDAQRLFTALKRDVSEIGDSLSYVAQSFRDSVAELSKQNTELNNTRSSLKSISNISQKILTTRSLEGDISTKELASLEKRAKLQFRSLEIAVKSGRLQKQNDGGAALKEAQDALKQEQKFFNAIQGIRKEQEEINKNSGVRLFTGLEDITNAIPGLNKFTGAFKQASTSAKEQARFNKTAFGDAQGLTKEQIKGLEIVKKGGGINQEKIKSLKLEKFFLDKNGDIIQGAAAKGRANALSAVKSLTPFKAGLQAIGPILKKALGPLALLKELADALKLVDKSSGELAKNLGISYDESLGMVSSMTDVANLSMDTFVTTEGLVKAQTQLSTALGTNAQLSSTLLVDFTKLTEQAGYSAEAATTLGKVSLATGQTTKNITTEFLGQAKALNLSNNLALNEKQLLESVAKTSKGTLATFAAKPKELSKAVFAAKKLGLEISQVEKIADGLLEIESSLTAEFEVEVITGKQLNLERARYFALTNDIAGVAKELGKQGVTQASFAESSRIEQEAVAAAMGMSRDELGQMLIEQQALSAVGAKDTEEAKAKFEALRAQYGEAEAIKRLGDETYARQLASQSVQERFNKTVAKLQDIFVSLAEPILAIVSPFMDLVTTVMPALNLAIIPIKAILEGIGFVISGLVKGIGFIGEGFSNIGKVLVGVLSPVFNSISESISAFIEPVVSVLSPVIDKISNVFNGIKNTISSIVDYTKQFAELTSMVVAGMAAGAAIQKRSLIIDGLRAAKLGVINAIQNKSLFKSIAGMATEAFKALGGIPIVGPALGAAAAVSAYMLGKSYMDKAGDVMSPADGKTVISTKEGGLFELSKNDDVLAAPNLFGNRGNDRNLQPPGATNVTVSLSKGDIMAIANAVREGASQAKINVNLDGNAVANNLQTPMAMNTRTISV